MRVAWKYWPLDHGEGGGTRKWKWGDSNGGCDDDKGENKGREEGIKRGEMRRGGALGGGRRGKDGWNAGMGDDRKGDERRQEGEVKKGGPWECRGEIDIGDAGATGITPHGREEQQKWWWQQGNRETTSNKGGRTREGTGGRHAKSAKYH